jgi:hypothetical protein
MSSTVADNVLPDPGTKPAPERITTAKAAAILGLTYRAVQMMAARGDIPGAAKFGHYTFDEARLRRYVQDKENELCRRKLRRKLKTRRAVSSETEYGGARSSSTKRDIVGRLRQMTVRKRKAAMRRTPSGSRT